jgi:hypothetical protein
LRKEFNFCQVLHSIWLQHAKNCVIMFVSRAEISQN